MKACPALLAILAPLFFACGPAEAPESGTEPAAALAPLDFEGRYEVTGVTIDQTTGAQRPIHGTVLLSEEDDGARYSSHFELWTLYPGSDSVAAEVVGTGEGDVVERRLEGTASTTLVISSAPGVDTGFAFIPRLVSQRLSSTSTATFEHGAVSIQLENLPAEGEVDYTPTRTMLVGYRVEEENDG
jgi:hypothetical protein